MTKTVKVEVVRSFVDKHDGAAHRIGEVLDVTEERLAQLNACGAEQNFVPLVKAVPEKKAKRK